jgi:ABC-type lipoprotein export system ATPase subunit
MLKKISLLGGQDKNGCPEAITRLDIQTGEVLAVVGPTGSGKTQLISDIEQYADGETPTRRRMLIDDVAIDEDESGLSRRMVAAVSQKMNFVIDINVADFISQHALVRSISDIEAVTGQVMEITNQLAGEPVSDHDNLTALSGGQARALMVADVALVSNSPVVLIDEIENAGIDRLKALSILTGHGKAVLVVTHDPMLMLMAERRVVMQNGGMYRLYETTPQEKSIMRQLSAVEKDICHLREDIRRGGYIDGKAEDGEGNAIWQEFICTVRSTSAELWKK